MKASADSESPKGARGPLVLHTSAFIFPSNEITFRNSKARTIRSPTHAPAGPPGAPQPAYTSACRENGAHHPISLPGNQKDEPPSFATKWRLPLGPQNRHNSLVSGAEWSGMSSSANQSGTEVMIPYLAPAIQARVERPSYNDAEEVGVVSGGFLPVS